MGIEFKRFISVTIGSIIYIFGIAYFVLPGNLIPGGFTGIATFQSRAHCLNCQCPSHGFRFIKDF